MMYFNKNITVYTINQKRFTFESVDFKDSGNGLAIKEGNVVIVFPYANVEYFKVEEFSECTTEK